MTVEAIIDTPLEAALPSNRIGRCQSEWITKLPQDLFIPPDAMSIYLEVFEGPLDLLLYLIKKHNLDILNIQVAEINRQYMQYVELMQIFHLELAADYLEMAAMLTEIKSRMLLPKDPSRIEEEEDPRASLIRRLQEYERFKHAAEAIDALPRLGRDLFQVTRPLPQDLVIEKVYEQIDVQVLVNALRQVYQRIDLSSQHLIQRETLSVRDRMANILDSLSSDEFQDIWQFLVPGEGRGGLIVTFLAALELTKETLIELQQSEAFAPIYIRVTREIDE